MQLLALALACRSPETDTGRDSAPPPAVVPFARTRTPLAETSAGGRAWKRGIIHLHSPWSHDACDGNGLPDGSPDATCLAHLRDALCDLSMDFAMLTDHPAHAAYQPYEDLLLPRGQDTTVDGVANRIACADGRGVLALPGIEDELMPVGLDRHAAAQGAEADALYNGTGPDTIAAEIAAGGTVLQAHTEQRSLPELLERQADGLAGVEIFNLHAMVDPDIREQSLGLDGFGLLDAIAPFLTGQTDAEPDLAFLAFYQEQSVSLARFDALNAVAPTIATAGTDAHENALPSLLSDGERVDSYRRMMRWFSNVLLVEGESPADLETALRAGRNFVAFEVLGTPSGFDARIGAQEMSGDAAPGATLEVSCPTLSTDTPQDGNAPTITVHVLKDGAPFAQGCGAHTLAERGVYRVRVDIVPAHLTTFLGDQAATLVRPYPWLYTGAFRVR
jgi:hypothetical protein